MILFVKSRQLLPFSLHLHMSTSQHTCAQVKRWEAKGKSGQIHWEVTWKDTGWQCISRLSLWIPLDDYSPWTGDVWGERCLTEHLHMTDSRGHSRPSCCQLPSTQKHPSTNRPLGLTIPLLDSLSPTSSTLSLWLCKWDKRSFESHTKLAFLRSHLFTLVYVHSCGEVAHVRLFSNGKC